MCCNTNSLNTYQYDVRMKASVIRMLRKNPDFVVEKKEKKVRNLQRVSDFHLIDIKGHHVTENKNYYLKIFDNNNIDVLEIFENKLTGSTYKTDLIVQCTVENNIAYIKHKNKYLYASDDSSIKLSSTSPTKNQRLQFHFTDNKLKIVRWNQNLYLTIDWVKASYGLVAFEKGDGTELYLDPDLGTGGTSQSVRFGGEN